MCGPPKVQHHVGLLDCYFVWPYPRSSANNSGKAVVRHDFWRALHLPHLCVVSWPCASSILIFLMEAVDEFYNLRSRLRSVTKLVSPSGARQLNCPAWLDLQHLSNIQFWLFFRLHLRHQLNVRISSLSWQLYCW